MSMENKAKGGDIELKTPMEIPSRGEEVYAFYVDKNWIYLLLYDGRDVDPFDVEPEFLEKFIKAVTVEGNIE